MDNKVFWGGWMFVCLMAGLFASIFYAAAYEASLENFVDDASYLITSNEGTPDALTERMQEHAEQRHKVSVGIEHTDGLYRIEVTRGFFDFCHQVNTEGFVADCGDEPLALHTSTFTVNFKTALGYTVIAALSLLTVIATINVTKSANKKFKLSHRHKLLNVCWYLTPVMSLLLKTRSRRQYRWLVKKMSWKMRERVAKQIVFHKFHKERQTQNGTGPVMFLFSALADDSSHVGFDFSVITDHMCKQEGIWNHESDRYINQKLYREAQQAILEDSPKFLNMMRESMKMHSWRPETMFAENVARTWPMTEEQIFETIRENPELTSCVLDNKHVDPETETLIRTVA